MESECVCFYECVEWDDDDDGLYRVSEERSVLFKSVDESNEVRTAISGGKRPNPSDLGS